MTDGSNVVDTPDVRPITIISIKPVSVDPGMTFLGAGILGPHRKHTTSFGRPWPRPHVHAAEGFVAKPYRKTYHQQGYEIVLGYRVTGSGWAAARNVTMIYMDANGNTQTQVMHSTFVSCPRPLKLGTCLKEATS